MSTDVHMEQTNLGDPTSYLTYVINQILGFFHCFLSGFFGSGYRPRAFVTNFFSWNIFSVEKTLDFSNIQNFEAALTFRFESKLPTGPIESGPSSDLGS
jgi:hypothetical protein